DLFCQISMITHFDEKSRFLTAYDLLHEADVRADNGNPGNHGFDHGYGKSLLLRFCRKNAYISSGKNVLYVTPEAKKMGVGKDPEFTGNGDEAGLHWSITND